MKLIIGLGNPGKKYEDTKHNMGFLAIDHFLQIEKTNYKNKFKGLYYEKNFDNEKVIFLKPQKFMNLSGEVIRDYLNYFKININDILIIYDDISYDFGKVKLKPKGSAGGHNGIKNIINNLGSSDFKRLKIGISSPDRNLKSYVLAKVQSMDELEKVLSTTDKIIEDFIYMDFVNLMNKYN